MATTMALTIKAFDLLLQQFLPLYPQEMAFFKFWWFIMLALPRLTLIGFCGTQNRACWQQFFGESKCAKMILFITILSIISH
jgi:hypothetical protein